MQDLLRVRKGTFRSLFLGIDKDIEMKGQKILAVDSSVVVKWLNRDDEANLDQSDKVFSDGRTGKVNVTAPELVKYEVGNALLNKELNLPAAKVSLSTIYTMPINFFTTDSDLAERTLEIASQTKITYYDATFVALAEKLDATLVTDNTKHQTKVKGVKVIALKDYK